jgi:hypothetical protein
MFDVLSPDGLSIEQDEYYPTVDEAQAAAELFAHRFSAQGFYSTFRWERIPVTEIAGRCRIVEVAPEEDE